MFGHSLVSLPFCCTYLPCFFTFCAFYPSFAYFSPPKPLAFSPLWSKVCVAFFSSLSSAEYLVSSYPCSFSWEMAEAVFREDLEDFDRGRKCLWLFLNEFFSSLLVVISFKYLDKSSKPDIHNIQTVKMCCSTSTLQLWSIKKVLSHTHTQK